MKKWLLIVVLWSTPLLAQQEDPVITYPRRTTVLPTTEPAPADVPVHSEPVIAPAQKQDPRRYMVPQEAASQKQPGFERTETQDNLYFGIGPFKLYDMERDKAAIGYLVAYNFGVNSNVSIRAGVEGLGNILNKDEASFFGAHMGMNYFFSEEDIAPYAGGDLGYAWTRVTGGKENTDGFTVGLNVGVQFFRTSDVSMDVAVRFVTLLAENRYGSPTGLGLRVGLYF